MIHQSLIYQDKFGNAAMRRVWSEDAMVQRWLGFGLLAQAGLAVGITLAIGRRFPDLAPVISTVVLSSVVIYEMIGPISARLALTRSGEARPQEIPAAAGLVY